MIASRSQCQAQVRAMNTACPPRRPFVASDARRRGQACLADHQPTTAFGDVLHTPAKSIAGVHNTRDFKLIADT